jgi:hypothetical protein
MGLQTAGVIGAGVTIALANVLTMRAPEALAPMLPNRPLQQPNARVRSKVGSCRDAAGCARGSSWISSPLSVSAAGREDDLSSAPLETLRQVERLRCAPGVSQEIGSAHVITRLEVSP